MLKCKHVFLIPCILEKKCEKFLKWERNLRFVREIGSNHTISTIISISFSIRNTIRLSQRKRRAQVSNFLFFIYEKRFASPSKCINSDGVGRFQVNVVLYFLNTQSFSGRNVRNLLRNKFLKLFCCPAVGVAANHSYNAALHLYRWNGTNELGCSACALKVDSLVLQFFLPTFCSVFLSFRFSLFMHLLTNSVLRFLLTFLSLSIFIEKGLLLSAVLTWNVFLCDFSDFFRCCPHVGIIRNAVQCSLHTHVARIVYDFASTSLSSLCQNKPFLSKDYLGLQTAHFMTRHSGAKGGEMKTKTLHDLLSSLTMPFAFNKLYIACSFNRHVIIYKVCVFFRWLTTLLQARKHIATWVNIQMNA